MSLIKFAFKTAPIYYTPKFLRIHTSSQPSIRNILNELILFLLLKGNTINVISFLPKVFVLRFSWMVLRHGIHREKSYHKCMLCSCAYKTKFSFEIMMFLISWLKVYYSTKLELWKGKKGWCVINHSSRLYSFFKTKLYF